MAKREYPPEVSQLENLKKINSRLAGHCLVYALNDGMVAMKSSIGFVEKVAVLRNPDSISCYNKTMINVPEMRGFLSTFKKTMTTVELDKEGLYLRDTKEEKFIYIPRMNPDTEVAHEQCQSFYQHLLHPKDLLHEQVMSAIADVCTASNYAGKGYTLIGEKDILRMRDNQVATANVRGVNVYMTKSLFGGLTATQDLSAINIPDIHSYKKYVLFKQIEPELIVFTLTAVLPS